MRVPGDPHGESPSLTGTAPISPTQHDEGLPINITSWRIIATLTLLSAIAAGVLFATGLKANAQGAPTGGHTRCDGAVAGQFRCDIHGS